MSDQREKVTRAIFEASTFYGKWDKQPLSNKEVCFDMADAAIAAMGQSVVKPLEWGDASRDPITARHEFGEYEIWQNESRGTVDLYGPNTRRVIKRECSLEAAKAAAQADFEKRILSNLTTAPAMDVQEAKLDKAVLVLLGKTREHAPGIDYVASRTMRKSEWRERLRDALRTLAEQEEKV